MNVLILPLHTAPTSTVSSNHQNENDKFRPMILTHPLKPLKPTKLMHSLRSGVISIGFCIALIPQASFAQYINLTLGGQLAPGLYGELALGNNPLPPVWNPQPMLMEPPAYNAPIAYIYAPTEHINNWRFYCARYNACQRAVFFVRVEEQNPWWERRLERGPLPENTYILERERRMERPGELIWDRRAEERQREIPLERRREERHEDRRDNWQVERGPERR